MIVVTGATGQLDWRVIESLLRIILASQIVAVVCNPAEATTLSWQDTTIHQADYSDEAVLTAALQDIDELLLISSSEVGQRASQHHNAINATKAAYVKFIAYTSLLHADTSPLGLADEHVVTERMLAESGIVYALLRSGWCTKNYLVSTPVALEHSVFVGAAGEGRITSAARVDYATTVTCVINENGYAGGTCELADDVGWALSRLTAELTKQSGKKAMYQDLSEVDLTAALKGMGLPAGLTGMLADSDTDASKGGLFNDSHALSELIGRLTTPLADSIRGTVQVLRVS